MCKKDSLSEAARHLESKLVCAYLIGSTQQRELLYQSGRHPRLRVYMYKESSHKLPHFHVNYAPEFEASISVETGEILAGKIPGKYFKSIQGWWQKNQGELHLAWDTLQSGEKPEVVW